MYYMTLENGTNIELTRVLETSMGVDGTTRRVLNVTCPAGQMGLDELDGLLCEENLGRVTVVNEAEETVLVDENGVPVPGEDGQPQMVVGVYTSVFENYSIRVKLSKEPGTVGYDEFNAPITEEQIVFVLARKTPAEIQMDAMMTAMKKAGMI